MSVLYLLAWRLFEFVVLLARRERSKELEILVLRNELSILKRQLRRPQFAPRIGFCSAALSRVVPRHWWAAFLVKPKTLLRWHRRHVARHWTYAATDSAANAEHPDWRARRFQGPPGG